MSISTEQDKINKVYAEIGATVYKKFAEGEETEFTEQCEKIKDSEAFIAETKAKILELKNSKTCAQCGAEVAKDVRFCPKCGANIAE